MIKMIYDENEKKTKQKMIKKKTPHFYQKKYILKYSRSSLENPLFPRLHQTEVNEDNYPLYYLVVSPTDWRGEDDPRC